MSKTPNHEYNSPEEGTMNWHEELNENFEALDTDVELRGEGPPGDHDYDAENGAKYLDTGSGEVYIGDADGWNLIGTLNGGGGGNGDIPDAGRYLSDDGGTREFTGPAEWENEGETDTNEATGTDATVGGGALNDASDMQTTISGGWNNEASGFNATVCGGRLNEASGEAATVGGGDGNVASGEGATVVGGGADGDNNVASGDYSTVLGGRSNTAEGESSIAAGLETTAEFDGSFVFAGSDSDDQFDEPFETTNADQFAVRASGTFINFGTGPQPQPAVRFVTGTDGDDEETGVQLLASGSSWQELSDRNAKESITDIDPTAVLDRLLSVPITEWSFKAQPDSRRHIGPMAQEFNEAFGDGTDERYINSSDARGVALAAIQGLSQRLDDAREKLAAKDDRIAELETELDRVDELESRLAALESSLD